MEVLGIIGMSLGCSGLTFGIMAFGQVACVRKELKELEKKLKDSGVLKEEAESKG